MLFQILLGVHILCGITAMVCSIAAIATQKGSSSHRSFGLYFFYGMTGIFITALVMAYIKTSTFLFLIALFSYYLAYTGWRYARRPTAIITKSDWVVCFAMLSASLMMITIGLLNFDFKKVQPIVLIVFGLLGGSISFNDALLYYRKIIPNKVRIAKHLGSMLGSTIAVYTAFLVTNISIAPAFILWLGPTFIFTPIIIYWSRKMGQ